MSFLSRAVRALTHNPQAMAASILMAAAPLKVLGVLPDYRDDEAEATADLITTFLTVVGFVWGLKQMPPDVPAASRD